MDLFVEATSATKPTRRHAALAMAEPPMSASTTASTGSEATPSGAPAQRPAGGGAGRGPRAGRCNQPWRGWGGPPRESEADMGGSAMASAEAGGSIRSESPCPLLGGGITDDTLLHIARFLTAAEDLLRLELTCPRFAAKVIKTPSVTGGGDGPAAAAEMLSIPAEAARPGRWRRERVSIYQWIITATRAITVPRRAMW